MKKITREQAEQLFLSSDVINSKVEQNKDELRVSMSLTGNKSCLIKYNITNHTKTYFLEDKN